LAITAYYQRQVAENRRHEADRHRKIAISRQLAAQSEILRDQKPNQLTTSALLAVQSLQLNPSLEAYQLLRNGLDLLSYPVSMKSFVDSILEAVISNDGKYIATRIIDYYYLGTPIVVWEAATGNEVTQIHGRGDRWVAMAFGPDNKKIRAASGSTAVTWHLPDGKEISRIQHKSSWSSRYDRPARFSRDGRYMASRRDNVLTVWDMDTKKRVANLEHTERLELVKFSKDGKYLAANDHKKSVVVWEIPEGKQIAHLTHPTIAGAFEFSLDGRLLATVTGMILKGSRQYEVSIFEIPSGRKICQIIHRNFVRDIAFSPKGSYLATFGNHKNVSIWRTDNGTLVSYLSQDDHVTSVAFSPNGRYLAIGCQDGTARLWDYYKVREIGRMTHSSPVEQVLFSPDGCHLATVTKNRTMRIWKVEKDPIFTDIQHINLFDVILSPDGQYLVAEVGFGSATNLIVTDLKSGLRKTTKVFGQYGLDGLAINSEVNYLAAANSRMLEVWDINSEGKSIYRLRIPERIKFMKFSPNGKFLGVSCKDNTLRILNTGNGEEIVRLAHNAEERFKFSPDHNHVCTLTADNRIQIWSILKGELIAELPHNSPCTYYTFSPNGSLLATAHKDSTIRTWQTHNGQMSITLKRPSLPVILAFNRDSSHLLSVEKDGSINEWEISGGNLFIYTKFEGKPAAFSPDANFFASTTDNDIRVWEVKTGREVVRITDKGKIDIIAFNKDGKYLVSASTGNRWDKNVGIRIWRWNPDDLLQETCDRLERNFTYDEWRQYLGDEPYRKTCQNLPLHDSFLKVQKKKVLTAVVKQKQ
jgi:WD40 repeat protein